MERERGTGRERGRGRRRGERERERDFKELVYAIVEDDKCEICRTGQQARGGENCSKKIRRQTSFFFREPQSFF